MLDLRSLQLVQLDILTEFDSLCKTLGLRYSLAYGTLLGAVRHSGFIPWDDDIDVCMLRQDYDRLIKVANEYLPSNYHLQTAYSDPNYPLDFAKLLLTDYNVSVAETMNLDITRGVFIDIFPIDACHNNRLIDWFDRLKIALARIPCFAAIDEQFESGFPRKQVMKLASLYIQRKGTQAIVAYIDSVRRRRNIPSNIYSYYYYTGDSPLKYKWSHRLPLALMNDLIELEFEGRRFPCMRDYDAFLSCSYGDYMLLPPEDKRRPDHELKEAD